MQKEISFAVKHIGVIVTMCVTLLGWGISIGAYSYKASQMETELHEMHVAVETMDREGTTPSKEARWTLLQHDKLLAEHSLELRRIGSSITDIQVDIRIIAEWVKEQKAAKGN